MQIEEYYRKIFRLTEEDLLEQLVSVTEIKILGKGELLACEGTPQTQVHFLIQGLLRGYFWAANGDDITDCFTFQCGAPAMPSLALGETASISIEALENSELLALPIPVVVEALQSRPTLVRIYNELLLRSLRYHWEIKSLMYQYTATERYLWFLKRYPNLAGKVKGKHM